MIAAISATSQNSNTGNKKKSGAHWDPAKYYQRTWSLDYQAGRPPPRLTREGSTAPVVPSSPACTL